MKHIQWFFNKIDFVGRNWGKPRKSFIDRVRDTRWSSVVAGVLLTLPTLWNALTKTSSHPIASLCISIGMLIVACAIAFIKVYSGKRSVR